MRRIGRLLSFSNAIACLALFVALGGSVYAAGKINGKHIKPNSIPGNRIKAKTLPGNRVKANSLAGNRVKTGTLGGGRIKSGSITGTQIKDGSLTGTQIDTSTLSEVTASKLSGIQYATSGVALGGVTTHSATATCPPGTGVIGGGAAVSDPENSYINDSAPTSGHNGWNARAWGEFGTSMTVTAICIVTG